MSYFAKVKDNKVIEVLRGEKEFFDTYIDNIPGVWIQCSYNTRGGVHYNPETGEPSEDQSKALRKNYPGIGWTYDDVLDAFIAPKPFLSWILDEQTGYWNAPIARPTDGKYYKWDEENTTWIEAERNV